MIAAKSSQPPFDQLGSVPLPYSGQLQDTYYADAFHHERWQQQLEQLNLLYVALTRAKDACFLCTPHQKRGSGKTTAHLLSTLLGPDATHLKGVWNEENTTWHTGTLPTLVRTQKKRLPPSISFPASPAQYTHVTQRIATPHQKGIWWHELLRKIPTIEAAPKLIEHYVKTEQLSIEESNQVQHTLNILFQDPRLKEWWSSPWKQYAEQTITLPSGSLYRPDRVMTAGRRAVVIDFKMGALLPVHHHQVATYMEVIKKLGYTHTQGFLLAIHTGKLTEVDAQPSSQAR